MKVPPDTALRPVHGPSGKRRTTVRTELVITPRKCRTCGEPIEVGTYCWSAYYGSGRYHLTCEATPAAPPPGPAPDEVLRCPQCGWFKAVETYDVCGRCHRASGRAP